MKIQEIKKKFLESFEKKGHKLYPSGSTLPHNDPTLLFVNAGMNQFKSYFLDEEKAPHSKMTTSQKCIRVGGKHNDLDNVGHTSRHLTFFEMLGNFSFGDYFKKEAIQMAFEISCDVLKIDPKQIFVSVYKEDLESYELWKAFLPESQICFMGEEDNYWSMGDTGPCGPCSELYFDKGDAFGDYSSPAHDPDGHRFIEYWNLVFMEFNKSKDGTKTKLPKPCIDTGMGLERITALLNGKESVFETNIFEALIQRLSKMTKVPYAANKAAYHVVCDHLRALSFAIADGAAPSNVDRGYVLRKILRRATRYARQLSITKPFMADLFPTLLEEMGDDYPELHKNKHRICELLTLEEESFIKTLSRGGNILNAIIEKSKTSDQKEISGKDAFTLKDTYGFPIEEICLLAKDHHLEVNLDTYEILEKEAREKSKKAHKSHSQEVKEQIFPEFVKKHGFSEFLREKSAHPEAAITGILHNGAFVNTLEKGQHGAIILDKTPFYAEMGGQRGDLGILKHHKASFHVADCKAPYPGVVMHEGVLKEGTLLVGEPIHAEIEVKKRIHIEKNHTATHMLHYALEQVLGPHIKQAGSYVSEKSLRLDFTHHKKLEENEIEALEKMINDAIFSAYEVEIEEMSYEDVKKNKDIKQLFGEKYGDTVRLVSVGDFSKELCGGTHVKNTSEIGLFKIVKEMSIAGGIRRIEAVTASEAMAFINEKEHLLKEMCKVIGAPEAKALESLKKLSTEYKEIKSEYKKLKKEQIAAMTEHLLNEKQEIDGIHYITKEVSMDSKEFGIFATELIGKLKNGLIILANNHPSACQIHIQKTKSATSLPSAKKLLDEILPLIEGRGGGSETCARGSAAKPQNLTKALSHIAALLQ
ncbi:MAG: Alanine--tRNA ligase [Chlamydiia bacterium]|nr:Alanine--tRNA ligase [Chlamydiia bacterium]